MKPAPQEAMKVLIEQIREAIPFRLSEAEVCSGECIGCVKKLLEFLDRELEEWHSRLDRGDVPRLGDINKLARTSKTIHKVLVRNGLI